MIKIDPEINKGRLAKFQKTAYELKIKYRKNLLKKNSTVLFENKINSKFEYFGRDEFSNAVIVKSNENLVGKVKNVKILKVSQNTLFGEINYNTIKKDFAA